MLSQAIKDLLLIHWRASLPVVAIEAMAGDETRCIISVIEVAKEFGKLLSGAEVPTFIFDQVNLLRVGQSHPEAGLQTTATNWTPEQDPVLEFLQHVRDTPGPAIFIALDIHKLLSGERKDMAVLRAIRSVAAEIKASHKKLVLLGEGIELDNELDGSLSLIDAGTPTQEEIKQFLNGRLKSIGEKYSKIRPDFKLTLTDEDTDRLVRAAQGLSLTEAYDHLRLCAGALGAIDEGAIEFINQKKMEKLARTGCEFSAQPDVELAGLENLKDWLKTRESIFHGKHPNPKLLPPKGILLLGPPGTGKTLIGKTVGKLWGVPVLSLSIDAILGSLVGQSEGNLKRILRLASTLKPCILFIDELEKAFGGSSDGGDGGVGKRILGILLSWMSENRGVFVIATANDIQSLPPELLRRGRFDQIFYVGLPNSEERAAILNVHLSKFDVQVGSKVLGSLVQATDGFSGAEIAAIVEDAVTEASAIGGAKAEDLMLDIAKQTRPLSDNINIPNAVLSITRPASRPVVKVSKAKQPTADVEMV
ncbi:AAA family ATPase [Leptolyngbya sp. AN02str]|uniref:AAA family ATPase n=1 Tax=Leptolyngbya sp. AN02str TaxID=3423363 RepID=UPI003D32326C